VTTSYVYIRVCVRDVSTRRRFVGEETAVDDELIYIVTYIYISSSESESRESGVTSHIYTPWYIYTCILFFRRFSSAVVSSSRTHTQIYIYYTVGRPPTDYIGETRHRFIYIYTNSCGGTSGFWLMCDLAWTWTLYIASGNNSVSKKTVSTVSAGGAGRGGCGTGFPCTLAHALLFSFIAAKTVAAQKPFGRRPSLNLLNGVHRDPIHGAPSEYTHSSFRRVSACNQKRLYFAHDRPERGACGEGVEGQSYWRLSTEGDEKTLRQT